MTEGRRYVALVLLVTALTQVLWMTVVPPFRGSDEFDHAFRAAGVASGQWRAEERADDGRGILVQVPPDLVEAAEGECTALPYTGYDDCHGAGDPGADLVLVGSGAGRYNPLFYWVMGSAAQSFEGTSALYAMRAVAGLLCLLLVGSAAWAASVRDGRWSRATLLFAMPPVMVFSMSIAAPNGIEMAAALALWSALLGFDRQGDPRVQRGLLAVASVGASVLVTVRLLGPVFALMVLLTVWVLQPGMVRRAYALYRRFLLGCLGVVLASVAGAVYWSLSVRATTPGPQSTGASEWLWSSLVAWPLQSIAAFPYRNQHGPLWVYPAVLLIFLALVVVAVRRGEARGRLVVVLAVLMSMALPVALSLATVSGFGLIWQGRYGLPYAVGIVLLAGAVLDRAGLPPAHVVRREQVLVVTSAVVLAVASAACLLKVLADELNRDVSMADPSWHPPGQALIWVVCAVVGAASIAAVLPGWRLAANASRRDSGQMESQTRGRGDD